jgi:chorismate mutase
MMRSAWECSSIEQIRRELDRIDRELIYTLKQRAEYLRKAAKLADAAGPGCLDALLRMMEQSRAEWAAEDGVPGRVVRGLCRDQWDAAHPDSHGEPRSAASSPNRLHGPIAESVLSVAG